MCKGIIEGTGEERGGGVNVCGGGGGGGVCVCRKEVPSD